MKIRILTLALALLGTSLSTSQATLLGYNTDPGGAYWDRGDAGSGYVIYDTFPSTSFVGHTPDTSFGVTSPALDQSLPVAPPGGLFGSGDRIYVHSSPTQFVLTGSTTFTIQTFVLQVKEHNGTAFSSTAPTLNGLAFSSKTTSSFTEGTFNQNIYTYTWTGLSITSFSMNFSSAGNFGSLDGLQADFSNQAIPEPSTYALLGLGLAALLWLRRRGVVCGSETSVQR